MSFHLKDHPLPAAQRSAELDAAEAKYCLTAFDLAAAPLGSRDWTLFWAGWQARSKMRTEPSQAHRQRPIPDELAQFEADARAAGMTTPEWGFGRRSDGEYASRYTAAAFRLWKNACASSRTPAPAAPSAWQPIETAPPENDPVLAFNRNGRITLETGCYLHNMMNAARIDEEECFYTHWAHAPEIPACSTEASGGTTS